MGGPGHHSPISQKGSILREGAPDHSFKSVRLAPASSHEATCRRPQLPFRHTIIGRVEKIYSTYSTALFIRLQGANRLLSNWALMKNGREPVMGRKLIRAGIFRDLRQKTTGLLRRDHENALELRQR